MHRHQSEDLRLRRSPSRIREESEGRPVQGSGASRGEVHRAGHSSGNAGRSEREGRRQADCRGPRNTTRALLMALMEFLTGKHLDRGLHVPDHKELTSHLPIRRLPFAPMLVVPLLAACRRAGDCASCMKARKWCAASRSRSAGGFVSVPMHAPATGRVVKIALAPGARGDLSPAIYITPYPSASQEILYGAPQDIETDDAGGNRPGGAGYRRSRPGRRGFSHARQAEGSRGQESRHGRRERLRMRTVSHHRSSRHAGTGRRGAARRAHRHAGAGRGAGRGRRGR